MGTLLAIIVGIYVYGAVGSAMYRLVKTKAPGTQYIDGALWRIVPSLIWGCAWPARLYRYFEAKRA